MVDLRQTMLHSPAFMGLSSVLLAALGGAALAGARRWGNWCLRKLRHQSAAAAPTPVETGLYVQMTIDEILDPPTCPDCGGSMVLRTAVSRTNFGAKFWGCHQFPKCRGTRTSKPV